MIDPLTQVAFAVYSNRGAYALLVGSGLSRSAEIKTGYEIVLDLADQIARVSGEDPFADPETWYRTKFGEELDYARLLERLGPTGAERQSILRHYFEPTPEETERGVKSPTSAHRAVAALVGAGYLRVIVTTNFDRLLEDAMADAGVRPYVIRGAADIDGMAPVNQLQCLIVKVHGDYLDTRIRNTPGELAVFDPPMDRLLDRLLDDHGLIVCGWSSDWDEALRNAVRRIANRRLTTFWTIRGDPSVAAKDLIANRSAVTVPIRDADQFFGDLLERVEALDDLRQSPPLTVDLAVAAAKRYLVDPSGRIRLRDLAKSETEAVLAAMAALGGDGDQPTDDEFERRMVVIEAATAKIAAIVSAGCFWGDQSHLGIWIETLQRLGNRGYDSGYEPLFKLHGYPATIVIYAGAVGAVASGRYDTLTSLLKAGIRQRDEERPAAFTLEAAQSLDHGALNRLLRIRENKPKTTWHVPASERIHHVIRIAARDAVPDDARFDELFYRVEALVSLAYGADGESRRHGLWFPPGLHSFHTREILGGAGTLAKLAAELEEQGDDWPPVRSGLFPSAERAKELVEKSSQQSARAGFGW